ncbi:Leu/Phe/Val dehydrogenase [Camelliibacillus cellulosilyticus]|uniref:Leu/Phe/Val dehydrogenase n=1 Tax=Camelliibacillus cellulosilyticus TaxID=2174486 RepID=A0ABV9GPB4_9BACL
MLDFECIKDYEQVIFCNDAASGLKAIIAIHDTTLGPALGGCRMRPYHSVDEALEDALRLAKGMTYKCAAADVDHGGGKAVIIGDPLKDKSPDLFRAFGQFVESLNGRFYTGTDMGTMPDDFVHSLKETRNIVGVPESYGGHGDSSVPTAEGVIYSLKATLRRLWHDEALGDKTYAVQGLGKVGFKVASRLLGKGAHLYVTDISAKAVDDLASLAETLPGKVTVVDAEAIYEVPADVFIPCALGAVINDATIERLRVKAVVGSANNQLLDDRHGEALRERGILYAPDYIVNAGGLIQVADELHDPNKERVMHKTMAIYDTITAIFETAERENISTTTAANAFCEQRIKTRRDRNSFFNRQLPPKWQIH